MFPMFDQILGATENIGERKREKKEVDSDQFLQFCSLQYCESWLIYLIFSEIYIA